MKALITVMLKEGVLDPQGKAIEHALHTLGFSKASHVRVGKQIELLLSHTDESAARAEAEAMCETLLANTVIEEYTITLAP